MKSHEAFTAAIKELEAMVEETREDPEFEMHYEYHTGKAAGLELAIELMTNKRQYKPPEQAKDDSILTDAYGLARLYQGGRNDND